MLSICVRAGDGEGSGRGGKGRVGRMEPPTVGDEGGELETLSSLLPASAGAQSHAQPRRPEVFRWKTPHSQYPSLAVSKARRKSAPLTLGLWGCWGLNRAPHAPVVLWKPSSPGMVLGGRADGKGLGVDEVMGWASRCD